MTSRGDKISQRYDAPASSNDRRLRNTGGSPQAENDHVAPPQRWGASHEDWQHFSETWCLAQDLLPVVSNPHAVISPDSSLKSLGKTPSRYSARRQVVGFSRWTEHISQPADIEIWSKEPDYGICIQTRNVTAIDIDIDNEAQALEVALAVLRTIGTSSANLPVRFRSNSGRLLIPLKRSVTARKSIIRTLHGQIEILVNGQQFVGAGTHPSGERYNWTSLEELLDLRLGLLQ